MKIIYYNVNDAQDHGQLLQQELPEAEVRLWRTGDVAHADYAVVWKPPVEMLAGRHLKAIFSLGAGVDALLRQGEQIPAQVPIVRLEDAGMGEQMADYVSHAVLRYYRQFDLYQRQADALQWQPMRPHHKDQFKVAILGLGVLGSIVAERLQLLNFPVMGWSRSGKSRAGLQCYAGSDGLQRCLEQARVVVCLLPMTDETKGLLNLTTLGYMEPGGYLINVGRGAQVNEADLSELLKSGHLAGATLDVFQNEPLALDDPMWQLPTLTITPHIAALTIMEVAHNQVAAKLRRVEQGLAISGIVDRRTGY